MAQQDFGGAQPIADWVNRYVGGPMRAVTGAVNRLPDPPRGAVDTSGHDEMVRQAMRSFQARQDAERAAAAAATAAPAAAPVTPARRIVKRTPTRTPARAASRR